MSDNLRQLTGAPLRQPGSYVVPEATQEPQAKPNKGFASMDPERQRGIAAGSQTKPNEKTSAGKKR